MSLSLCVYALASRFEGCRNFYVSYTLFDEVDDDQFLFLFLSSSAGVSRFSVIAVHLTSTVRQAKGLRRKTHTRQKVGEEMRIDRDGNKLR